MGVYATQADFLAYSEGSTITDAAKFERILARAERDVDSILPPREVVAATGLKYDPLTQLAAYQRTALSRAACAQAEYRIKMGEEFFREHQLPQVSGPDFSHSGTLPYIGPKVSRELASGNLLTRWLSLARR